MAWQSTTRLQVSGHRFLVRRVECALLGGDPEDGRQPARARSQAVSAGYLLAVAVLAGCSLLAVLAPQPTLGDASIVLGQRSGALYVRVGEVWHPVLNLASARLIAATPADPRAVPESVLARARRGPLLGIPGAPQLIGDPLPGDQSAWTICDSGADTTVIVGPIRVGGAEAVADGPPVLVTADSGATTQLLYQGRRALVDLADPTVVRALRLDGRVARPVSGLLLDAIPEAPPIAAPPVSGAGGDPPGTPAGRNFGTPPAPPDDARATLCASWAAGHTVLLALAGLPLPAGAAPVVLAQADGDGPRLDAVYLPPGRTAYVRSVGLTGDRPGGLHYLVADTGVRFQIPDDQAAAELGLPGGAVAAPWPMLAALPAGPELSGRQALVARDIVAADAP